MGLGDMQSSSESVEKTDWCGRRERAGVTCMCLGIFNIIIITLLVWLNVLDILYLLGVAIPLSLVVLGLNYILPQRPRYIPADYPSSSSSQSLISHRKRVVPSYDEDLDKPHNLTLLTQVSVSGTTASCDECKLEDFDLPLDISQDVSSDNTTVVISSTVQDDHKSSGSKFDMAVLVDKT